MFDIYFWQFNLILSFKNVRLKNLLFYLFIENIIS